MQIVLFKDALEHFGAKELKRYGIDYEGREWLKRATIDLSDLSTQKINGLKNALAKISSKQKIYGIQTAIKDVDNWLFVKKGNANRVKARNSAQAAQLLIEYLRPVPGHRIYKRGINEGNVCFAYYVNTITHREKEITPRGVIPAYLSISLLFQEFGGGEGMRIRLEDDNCRGKTASDILLERSFLIETDELRKQYLDDFKRFETESKVIGTQYYATGFASTDVDGNDDDDDDNNYWWRRSVKTIKLDRSGEPAKVVMDLFYESDKKEGEDRIHVNSMFWQDKPGWLDDDEDGDIGDDICESENIRPEIPIHPLVACFDLRRHLRLKIHIGQLTLYKYDNKLGDKLVLPHEHRSLIGTLLEQAMTFKDIVRGKGQGAVVLCAGQPGTGKTLTSEVYAEVCGRPLYSVQCSQLGTSPDDLEEQLLKIFVRSQRWNAILLLDEADVYVSKRGADLTQNAIVGVFLRTLEYYNGVMFLTTNRADLVDDAIASRCIARIDYLIPKKDDQKKIWKILAETTGAKLSESELDQILQDNPDLSGRDIKNLMKLALMVGAGKGDAITAKTIKYVKQFKPTKEEKS